MECCVCYNNKIMVTTTCKHNICLHCILKLKKDLCPYCRTKIDDLPEKIKDIINNNMNNDSMDEEPLVGGGGGLGIYWDAPGSNYFNLSEAVKDLLDELKQIDSETWRHIRNDVNNNNNGSFYNELWLRDLIDSKKNSGFY